MKRFEKVLKKNVRKISWNVLKRLGKRLKENRNQKGHEMSGKVLKIA